MALSKDHDRKRGQGGPPSLPSRCKSAASFCFLVIADCNKFSEIAGGSRSKSSFLETIQWVSQCARHLKLRMAVSRSSVTIASIRYVADNSRVNTYWGSAANYLSLLIVNKKNHFLLATDECQDKDIWSQSCQHSCLRSLTDSKKQQNIIHKRLCCRRWFSQICQRQLSVKMKASFVIFIEVAETLKARHLSFDKHQTAY